MHRLCRPASRAATWRGPHEAHGRRQRVVLDDPELDRDVVLIAAVEDGDRALEVQQRARRAVIVRWSLHARVSVSSCRWATNKAGRDVLKVPQLGCSDGIWPSRLYTSARTRELCCAAHERPSVSTAGPSHGSREAAHRVALQRRQDLVQVAHVVGVHGGERGRRVSGGTAGAHCGWREAVASRRGGAGRRREAEEGGGRRRRGAAVALGLCECKGKSGREGRHLTHVSG